MPEITLDDLLAWEPRLRPYTSDALHGDLDPSAGEREVSWAVSVRATAPMLPVIRGGEVVLLSSRTLADAGVTLPVLLRELAGHGVAAVVLDRAPGQTSPVPVLLADLITVDLENELNRLLTERRSEIYRSGTELGRQLTSALSAGADLALLLSVASTFLSVPLHVVDTRGDTLAIAGDLPPAPPTARDGLLTHRLITGETLRIGPVPPAKRAIVRLAAERIAQAAENAIQRAADSRPRGHARAGAVSALLTGVPGEAPRLAATLGFPASGAYRVMLASPEIDLVALQRALAPIGTVHDGTPIDNAHVGLIELRAEPAPSRTASPRRKEGPTPLPDLPVGWLALSSPAVGVSKLPEAAREARFTAALLHIGALPRRVARFDAVDDLGAFRLLYHLWGTPALARFATDALGDLLLRDRRGILRETLLAYLTCGGSQVDAAAALHIHRNTLAYRLKQISSLTGRDASDPAHHLTYHLALLAARLPPPPVP